jgi:endonuclease YncB( thermonuclease family)
MAFAKKNQLHLKIIYVAALFIFSASFIGCKSQLFNRKIQAQVIEVIDGDTVKLADNKIVRYIGLDTPELHKRVGEDWVDNPEPFGEEAKQFNESLVKGKSVSLVLDVEQKDKYGRLLAYCFVDNIFVNERILEEGLGMLYTRPPNVRYTEILVAAQKKARENQKGLWQGENFIYAKDAYKYINQMATVEGRVIKVAESSNVVYLNFGKNYKDDFTVVIFRSDLPSFIAAGISPARFKDKVVQVTGKIKEYNGPEIIVRHPSQIEIVK